ncbi:MAG TPA: hypothetical protein VET69_10425 [Terriglobales bacterium]|jgi:hypothetical protein|nr:hypothetical protein [Terriglobales bacterium]
MIELVVTIGMTVGSLLLFGYWFRYTCLLILSAKTTQDYAGEVAAANQLSFLEVQATLRAGVPAALDPLQAALDRDYALVTYLLKNAALAAGHRSVETRMLAMNYGLMRAWFRLSRQFSLEASRRALEEMSQVVAHLANVMGEQAACGAAAA